MIRKQVRFGKCPVLYRLSPVSRPFYNTYTTDGFSIQYFTVVQGSQIYTPNQTGRGGIFCNHTPCLSHLLTFKCGHLMRVQIRQQLP